MVLSGHKLPVTKIKFIPSMNLLISVSEDKSIKIWSVKDGKNYQTI